MRRRMNPEERFNELIEAALHLAQAIHYTHLNPRKIAERVGCSPALISHYLGTKETLRATVLREALSRNQGRIINQAMMMGDIDRCGQLSLKMSEQEYMCVE